MTRLRYAGLDFNTAFDELVGHLQAEYGEDFTNFAVTDLAVVLIDLLAYASDGLGFYLDQRIGELLGATVQTELAAQLLLRFWGYKRRGAAPSSDDLELEIPEVLGTTVAIPAGTLLRGPGDIVFQTAQAVEFLAGETGGAVAKRVGITQSTAVAETFVSTGTAYQSFGLRRLREGEFIAHGSVVVTVNGTTYTEADFLRFGDAAAFECDYVGDPPRVRLGSARAGGIPPQGASIRVAYRVTRGLAGNVEPGTIEGLLTPLLVAGSTIQVTTTLAERTTAGDDPETIEAALENAPRQFKARRVAVTRGDYLALATGFSDPVGGRVAAASALVARSAAEDGRFQYEAAVIRSSVGTIVAAANTAVAALVTERQNLDNGLDAIDTALTDAATAIAAALTAIATARTADQAALTALAQVGTVVANASTTVTTARTTVQGIASGGSDQLTTNTQTALVNGLNAALGLLTALTSTAASAQASANTVLTQLNTLQVSLRDTVGDSGAGGSATALSRAGGGYTTARAAWTGLDAPATTLQTQILAAGTGANATIGAALDALGDHLSTILADEARANCVSVPILTRDAAGFYAAPPVALQRALQAYLEARADITHSVSVVSGENALVPVVMRVTLTVPATANPRTMEALGLATSYDLLRNRAFGLGLYNSEAVTRLGAIQLVSFVNVEILGHLDGGTVVTTYLDALGNLLIPADRVLTAGRVEVVIQHEAA